MGNKGDKMRYASVEANLLLLERLAVLDLTSKKMFGGHGIFYDGKMIGLIDSKGKAFLKADESTVLKYHDAGSEKHSRMPYYSIPEKILNDVDQLLIWARESIEVSKK
ncbi:MAG: TfoX/Sxy family protein [Schleiferiaceae bacterium]|jgi:DNA transformation protein|nr:TfoX/Sxy family protein [Schleiferiaceae bacterium]